MNQLMPRRGHRVVLFRALWLFVKTAYHQTRKGYRQYHRLLETDNGRNAGRDWLEEWFDGLMFGTQMLLENHELKQEIERLRKELKRYK